MSEVAFRRMRREGRPVRRLPVVLDYPERGDIYDEKLDRWATRVAAPLTGTLARLGHLGSGGFLTRAATEEVTLTSLDDAALKERILDLGLAMRKEHSLKGRSAERALAAMREAARRQLGLRAYDVQMRAGRSLLAGAIAEMRTGEGKSLVAGITAATAALLREPVHVVTSNDYLAKRDGEEMTALFSYLGLSCGIVQAGQSETERQGLYRSDIVYGTNKELAFDYLRDRTVLRNRPGHLRRKVDGLLRQGDTSRLRMRGLAIAIVDEADSVMIDEARTPLIIAANDGQPVDLAMFEEARRAADSLVAGRHYKISPQRDRVELTEAGFDALDELAEGAESSFRISVIREHAVTQALSAAHVFRRDEHYIVKDGKVAIVDEFTGRSQPDRSWSDGLHQMIELKEGVEPTAPNETLARMSYQRFFRRYRHLCGMTGTARDARWEFWSVYRKPVVPIPTNRPDARVSEPDRLFRRADEKWTAVTTRVAALRADGVPVLVGVRSISAGRALSAKLTASSVPHQVLDAEQDADEAELISKAAEPGMVTVATNIAGRGVDIRLADGVKERGGLHVLMTERHDSRRVDRQLAGRCGRQGDPGRVMTYLSLEDDLLQGRGAAPLARAARFALSTFGARAASMFLRLRQRQVERAHAAMRRDLMEADTSQQDMLAVSGLGE